MGNGQKFDSKDMLDHAWKYFELHSGQRISMFNFFLVVSTSLAAGLGYCLQGNKALGWLGTVAGALLFFVSLVFGKIDGRTATLVKYAENAIAAVEAGFPEPTVRLVANEAAGTAKTIEGEGPHKGMWSYSKSFRLAFQAMAVLGIIGGVLSALRGAGYINW